MNNNPAVGRRMKGAAKLDRLKLAAALCAGLVCSPPTQVHAQESAGDTPRIESIFVTGSRISVPGNRNASQPLSVINTEAFSDSGALLIAEALNQLPQLGNALEGGSSIIALNNGFGAGTQTVNLRNLGSNRTLVLVNGRRHVGGDVGTSAVDLSMIPAGLIDRIDIVTGATSSIYGSDAVTGVINVILRENFEGTSFTARAGGTSEGGGEEYAFTATHGGVFDSGDYIVGLEYTSQDKILGRDRDYALLDGSAGTGLAATGAGSGVNPGGLYVSSAGGTGGFGPSGNFTQPFAERFQRMPYRSLQNEVERLVVSGRAGFDMSDTVSAFIEGSLADTEVVVDLEPQLAIFSNAGFASSGTAGFRFPTATAAAVPSVGADLRAVTRRFLEFGPRASQIDRGLARFAVGLDADLGFAEGHFSYQYGRIEAEQTDFDTVDKLALVNAINPVSCAATPGCSFVNVYGRGTIDPASENSIANDLVSNSEGDQHVYSAWINGDALEFSSGPLRYVLGVEYRDESAEINPHPALIAVPDPVGNSGNPVGLQGTRTFFGSTTGEYDVLEAYGELQVPLGENFDLGLSARASDYSTVGQETTWGANAQWRLSETFTLRASVGEATRAPNLQELFSPDSSRTSEIVDPCDTMTDEGDLRSQPASCQQFVDASFDPSNLESNVRAVSGGNPNLESETADTVSLGVVIQTDEDLVFSIDYFDIEMTNVLAPAFGTQATVDNCISTGNPFFCENVIRDPATGFVTTVRSEQVNLASDSVAGIEYALQGSFDAGSGQILVNGIYTRLLERDRQVNDTSAIEDLVGRVDNVQDKLNFGVSYRADRIDLGLMFRHIGNGIQSISADPDVALGNEIDSITYLDLFASYRVNDSVLLRAGVENATNEDAPIVTSLFEGVGAGGAIAPGLYDIRGRFFYTGLEVNF